MRKKKDVIFRHSVPKVRCAYLEIWRGLIQIPAQAVSVALLGIAVVTVYLVSNQFDHTRAVNLFALSPTEAKIADDVALRSVAHIPAASKVPRSKNSEDDNSILDRATQDEVEAEALVQPKISQHNRKKVQRSQSLYSGSHVSGDPIGVHTGHLANADGLRALKMGPLHMGASDLAALKAEQEQIADTQINGLKAELRSLTENRQQILNSLALQRQSSAVKAAHDEAIADRVRLHRAVGTATTRNLRLAMRAEALARKRAIEARAVARNEVAIAQVERQRAARLEAQQQAAIAAASAAEAAAHERARARRSHRARRYHTAMRAYTSQLQKYVATDMDLLGQLRSAEDSAAVEPHIADSGLWRQPAGPADLPDVDPALFMNNAPLRDEDGLAAFKAVRGATQLSQTSGPAGGGPLGRVLSQELRGLDRLQLAAAKSSAAALPARAARRRPGGGLAEPMKLAMGAEAAAADAAASEGPAAAAAADGVRISAAQRPVALVRIPLGAHEVRRPPPTPP
jgi:hypothetical protein